MKKNQQCFVTLLLAAFILLIPCYGSGQQITFQQASFDLPFKMAALGELTAYVPANNSIFIFGGCAEPQSWLNTVIRMDLNTEQTEVLPVPLPFIADGQLAVAYNSENNKVYLFHLKDVYSFDPMTQAVNLIGSNISPESVIDYVIAKYVPSKDVIYIFGNRGSGRGNFTLKFDPATNNITTLSNHPLPNNNTSMAVAYSDLNDVVYLFGGNFSSGYFDLIQKFDPHTETFTELLLTLPHDLGGITAVPNFFEDVIYLIGGQNSSGMKDVVYKFNCNDETLEEAGNIPMTLSMCGAEFIPHKERIYVFGGTYEGLGGYWPATDKVFYADLNPVIQVVIDIKPGSFPNSINPKSKGIIPVAILSTRKAQGEDIDFDATSVDPSSVEFGPNGAKKAHKKAHFEDVDGDGDMDLLLHFKTQQTGIQCGDTEVTLTGITYDGQQIVGTDEIKTVGCKLLKDINDEFTENITNPDNFCLMQNHPNPFNPSTNISFNLPKENHVKIEVFNYRGETVSILLDNMVSASRHSVVFDASNLPSGLYFYRIQAGEFEQVNKMLLVR